MLNDYPFGGLRKRSEDAGRIGMSQEGFDKTARETIEKKSAAGTVAPVESIITRNKYAETVADA